MPMVKKVFAGLALGAALTSGALVLGVTAASASIGRDDDHHNRDNDRDKTSDRSHENDSDNWWKNQDLWQRNENCWWDQMNWKTQKDDHSAFGIAAKDVAVGFQDKTDKDDWYNNNQWWNRNDHNNNRDNVWRDKDDRTNDNVREDDRRH